MNKYLLAMVLIIVLIFTGCENTPTIQPLELSEEESTHIAALLPSQTNYKLYEIILNVEEYSKLNLVCDFYSYGKLISSAETAGFMNNDAIDGKTRNIIVGVSTNNTDLTISCSVLGGVSKYSINMTDFEVFDPDKWGILANANIIKNSDSDYVIYHSVYSEGAVSSHGDGPFDPEELSEYPFYYTVRCVFE